MRRLAQRHRRTDATIDGMELHAVTIARRRLVVAWLALAAASLSLFPVQRAAAQAAPGGAKPSEVKVSVAGGPALPLGRAAERWTVLLTEGSEGRLVAKLHPGASLAGRDPAREFLALKDGNADLAVGSALRWSLQVPALGVFGLPWIAPENRELEALVASESLRDALAVKLDAAGVVLVALAPLGHREIATTSRPIRAPEDVQGLRLRAAPLPLLHDMLLALGAKPQAMSFTEAQAAFAKGELDGQEGRPSSLATARAHASGQRHLTDWGAIADSMVFAVRKALWASWDEAQREAARRTARQAIAETAAIAREEAAVKELAQNGIAVIRITPAGHAVFRAAVKDVSARWREAIGGEIVALAERVVAGAAPVPAKGS